MKYLVILLAVGSIAMAAEMPPQAPPIELAAAYLPPQEPDEYIPPEPKPAPAPRVIRVMSAMNCEGGVCTPVEYSSAPMIYNSAPMIGRSSGGIFRGGLFRGRAARGGG